MARISSATDEVTRIRGSLVQHGRFNDRIYLMELEPSGMPGILNELNELAEREKYGKIFAKVPARFWSEFNKDGYMTEAIVPGFYGGTEDGGFMGKFLDPARGTSDDMEIVMKVLDTSLAKAGGGFNGPADGDYETRRCTPEDTPAMADLYSNVFVSYPFPIFDPEYLEKKMGNDVRYYGTWESGNLAAVSAAEVNSESGNVEMTDFATHPKHRGKNLAAGLLSEMENSMGDADVRLAYTIARTESYGMNITFARLGYTFAGTLVNNTNIGGHIESMNVWYKGLG